MSKLIPGNHKHLTLKERLYIEHSLNEGSSLKDIARFLCKDPTTISKEIKLHRVQNTWNKGSFNNPYNFCVHRFRCKKTNACEKIILCDTLCRSCLKCNTVCSRFERESCSRLDKAPFVCNGCQKRKTFVPYQRSMITMPTQLSAFTKNSALPLGQVLINPAQKCTALMRWLPHSSGRGNLPT